MADERIVVLLRVHKKSAEYDVEIPTDITGNELIFGLNEGFHLGMDTSDLSRCCLKTENPIALIRGNKLVYEFGLHNGTIINVT